MLRRVPLVRTDLSEERIAYIFRIKKNQRGRNNVSSNYLLAIIISSCLDYRATQILHNLSTPLNSNTFLFEEWCLLGR
jgi:hypothetical protein